MPIPLCNELGIDLVLHLYRSSGPSLRPLTFLGSALNLRASEGKRTSPPDQGEYFAQDGMDWDDVATYRLFHDV
jgi:hypothetical protein